MKNQMSKIVTTLIAVSFILTSCGNPLQKTGSTDQESQLNWVPTSGTTATLERRDLQDSFQLKVLITNATGDLSSDYINRGLERTVNLSIDNSGAGSRLAVGTLMMFDVTEVRNGYQIDFASPYNQINLIGSAGDEGWVERGISSTLVTSLSENNIEADLTFEFDNQTTGESGTLVLGISLNRIPSPSFADDSRFVRRSVEDSFSKKVGYFDQGDNIKKFLLPNDGGKIVFWIEDYPVELQQDAIQAIESWNDVFGSDVIEAKINRGVDKWGDRTSNVVKWVFVDAGFSGRASPVYAYPSGQVYSGNVQMNSKPYQTLVNRVTISQAASARLAQIGASIGGEVLAEIPGEVPFVPFYIGHSQETVELALRKSYHDTLVHEIGHVLGLRHNFKGSLVPDSANQSASVMDYGPRAESDYAEFGKGPGSYDRMAIRWGYFGEEPTAHEFCTDGDVTSDWQCNKGDWKDPIDFVKNGLMGAVSFFGEFDRIIVDETERTDFFNNIKTFLELHQKLSVVDMPFLERSRFRNEAQPKLEELWELRLSGAQRSNHKAMLKIGKPFLKCLTTNDISNWNSCD